MANAKCKHCGCDSIEEDPAHGYTVCTSCGAVLEDSSIVSQIQFEENAQGGSHSVGQFVSSESRGGASGFGGSFRSGVLGRESREITIQRAKKEITRLAQLLRLGPTSIDAALNLYKVALQNNLTKGRQHSHVVSACLYMQCRLEGTPHLLIDFSEALQTCVFTLGRTFLRLSHALCITLPFMDPCIYVLRYASQLDFGKQTHAVSMTALRLVSRMKRDNIHTGRRPSGLCGAALLIAARLHDFSRDISDIIKVVKVHDSTLRKRLMEFGSTPSSALSLEEFLKTDLEEEQDPPSFIASSKKDEERLQNVIEYSDTFTEFQREIDRQLEERINKRKRKRNDPIDAISESISGEIEQVGDCIRESTLDAINECLPSSEELESVENQSSISQSVSLGPTLVTMGLLRSEESEQVEPPNKEATEESENLELDDIDEDEIDSYIMSETEVKYKDKIWMQINENYLREQQEKKERLAREKEEAANKPEKKKRKVTKRSKAGVANTPEEAIERMLVEKNISSKINYDVLKTLNMGSVKPQEKTVNSNLPVENEIKSTAEPKVSSRPLSLSKSKHFTPNIDVLKKTHDTSSKAKTQDIKSEAAPPNVPEALSTTPDKLEEDNFPEDDDYFEDDNPAEDAQGMSLAEMLNQHGDDDDYYGDEYDEY